MKTSMQKLFFALAWLALPALVQAQDAYSTNADGSIYTYSTNADGSANIEAYSGPPWVVTIPTHINGLTVTTIGTNAFYASSLTSVIIPNSVTSIGENAFLDDSLTSVTIPSSVTSIGAYAFYSCTSLSSVTILNGVTSIGVGAFQECTSLTNITIPNSVTSIGDEAFTHCISLTSVTIGNSVTSIGDNAFADCFSLTSVTIPNSVTSIGDYAFETSGLKTVTIPNSVTSIGESAFFMCTSLTSVTIGNSVTNIGDGAFYECYGLTSVTIPNSVTSIGDSVFGNCTSLTSVTIPNGVTSIGDYAFANTRLTSVTIPNSVTSIEEQAFAFCSGLTSVTIPNSVTSIGDFAFEYCSSLTGVYFQGKSPSPTNDSTVFSGDPATVYYLPGTTGWGAMFDGLPTALWFLPNPVILNFEPGFGVQPGGFGFTISWATNASVVVEAATNLANPVWIPVSTSPLTSGTNYFSDPQWTNYPERFYRAVGAFTVGGTLTGLPAGDTVTLQDNGGDDLTLSTNGTFTFPTALPNGQSYSVTVSGTSAQVECSLANGSGTISGANVTNVAAQCRHTCPALTGNLDVDMYNAAVSDGTANGGVPGVMLTQNGGPYRVTADGPYVNNVARAYSDECVFTTIVGTTSCSSTTLPSGGNFIQFGTVLECGFGPYQY